MMSAMETPIHVDKMWLKEPKIRLLKAIVGPGPFSGERICQIRILTGNLSTSTSTTITIPSRYSWGSDFTHKPREYRRGWIAVYRVEFIGNRCLVETPEGSLWVFQEDMMHLSEECLKDLYA